MYYSHTGLRPLTIGIILAMLMLGLTRTTHSSNIYYKKEEN